MHVNCTLRKKFGIVVISAMLISLVMGAPIAMLQYQLFQLEVFELISPKLVAILQTYFPLIINLIIIVSAISYAIKFFVIKPILYIKKELEGN